MFSLSKIYHLAFFDWHIQQTENFIPAFKRCQLLDPFSRCAAVFGKLNWQEPASNWASLLFPWRCTTSAKIIYLCALWFAHSTDCGVTFFVSFCLSNFFAWYLSARWQDRLAGSRSKGFRPQQNTGILIIHICFTHWPDRAHLMIGCVWSSTMSCWSDKFAPSFKVNFWKGCCNKGVLVLHRRAVSWCWYIPHPCKKKTPQIGETESRKKQCNTESPLIHTNRPPTWEKLTGRILMLRRWFH